MGSSVIWPLCTGNFNRFPDEAKRDDPEAEKYIFPSFLDSTYWVSFDNLQVFNNIVVLSQQS